MNAGKILGAGCWESVGNRLKRTWIKEQWFWVGRRSGREECALEGAPSYNASRTLGETLEEALAQER